MHVTHRLRRRTVLFLAAAAAIVVPVAAAVAPANAAPFPRFVSVPVSSVRVLQPIDWVTSNGDGGSYRIPAPFSPNNACLDADSDTVGRNGGKVQTWTCNGSHNQNWAFDSTNVTGLYRIRTGANGKCLDADNRFGGGNNTTIQMWDCLGPGQRNQFWWLVDNGDSLLLVSNLDGRCALANDTWARGDTVVLFDCQPPAIPAGPQPQAKWMLHTF